MKWQFSTKFYFKWTFYGKLILKRSSDAEDWFCNKAAVQQKVPFQMDFLQKANSKKIFRRRGLVLVIKLQFSTKFHFKWTFYGKLIMFRRKILVLQ